MTYNRSAYQAAATVAPAIEAHFKKLLQSAAQQGETNLAPAPSLKMISSVIDVAFWASLRREEGRSPKISLAYLPPAAAGQPLVFEEPILLTPYILTKLAPAVERSASTWAFGTKMATCMCGELPAPSPTDAWCLK
jgi:hypothetical protein